MSVVEVAFASSVVTGDFEGIEERFHIGDVTTSLTVTLMVCGFGIGPLLWSPLVCTPHKSFVHMLIKSSNLE